MDLSEVLFQELDEDYSEENVKKTLEVLENKIGGSVSYYEGTNSAGNEELIALADLLREFVPDIKKGDYRYLNKLLYTYGIN